MRRLAVLAIGLVSVACSTGRTPPEQLDVFLIRQADIGAEARPAAALSGATALPRLRSFLPINQDVTLELKNAGFQSGKAAAFEVAGAPSTAGPRTSVLYQSIAMTFFSPDGAAEAMRILRTGLAAFSSKETTVDGVPGEERFLLRGAPGSVTPQMFLVWRRANVLVVLKRSPASDDPAGLIQIARAVDARAPRPT